MRLESASAEDRRRIEELLRASGLPHEDLESSPVDLFVGAVDGRFVGAVGLEGYGQDALLRSLVVPDDRRGQGYGTALCRAIEAEALGSGVGRLYLLTEGAAAFFERLGFEAIDRSETPDAIRETAEFRELCGDAATCLRKRIE